MLQTVEDTISGMAAPFPMKIQCVAMYLTGDDALTESATSDDALSRQITAKAIPSSDMITAALETYLYGKALRCF
jgi:hypothetical protein